MLLFDQGNEICQIIFELVYIIDITSSLWFRAMTSQVWSIYYSEPLATNEFG
jgi:hypothetical protein